MYWAWKLETTDHHTKNFIQNGSGKGGKEEREEEGESLLKDSLGLQAFQHHLDCHLCDHYPCPSVLIIRSFHCNTRVYTQSSGGNSSAQDFPGLGYTGICRERLWCCGKLLLVPQKTKEPSASTQLNHTAFIYSSQRNNDGRRQFRFSFCIIPSWKWSLGGKPEKPGLILHSVMKNKKYIWVASIVEGNLLKSIFLHGESSEHHGPLFCCFMGKQRLWGFSNAKKRLIQ